MNFPWDDRAAWSATRGQPAQRSDDGLWQDVDASLLTEREAQAKRPEALEAYRTVHLNQVALKRLLARTPSERDITNGSQPAVMTLPMPDGTFGRFAIEESPVLSAELAAQYPDLKTYQGQGLDDPTSVARLDWTPSGFHAMILTTGGTVLIDPDRQGRTDVYLSYSKRDVSRAAVGPFRCQTMPRRNQRTPDQRPPLSPTTLRLYRLAVATTGEFTQASGGTVEAATAAVATVINRVNAIFERDVSIRLVLVQTAVFTDPASDPYEDGNERQMAEANQGVLDQRVGPGNYDLGQVFGLRSGGGIALGTACVNGEKGKGATNMGDSPVEAFAVGYVAHGLGHQFSANHTFNGSSAEACGDNARVPETAYEPGTGSTIMGIASLCPSGGVVQDLQMDSDDYFHAISLKEILDYTSGPGRVVTACPGNPTACCGQANPDAVLNRPPGVNADEAYLIPAGTPFMLFASGLDPDDDDRGTLTYCWEEIDLGPASPPNEDDGKRPLFRSILPTSFRGRMFPRLEFILNGTNNPPETYMVGTQSFLSGETLPKTRRSMRFRVTLRDNRTRGGSGGAVGFVDTVVTTFPEVQPFYIIEPNTPVKWKRGQLQTILWNEGGSESEPINTHAVQVFLSVDGGRDFFYVLASGVANTGRWVFLLPDTVPATTRARLKLQALGNIFFDVSDADFIIE